MSRIRRDVAKLGKGWCPELEWYARAVGKLKSAAPNVRTGWRYLGAIHGFEEAQWRDLGVILPTEPLPPTSERNDRMWNQCQHQGWYFLPWHRGYLWAFEAIVSAKIEELGGPRDWALPYWNYFDDSDPQSRDIPAAFLDPVLPDGTPNALSDVPRGPTNRLGPVPWFPSDIDLEAMKVEFYTSALRSQGFGGGMTAFNQFGGQTGALESDPHNAVHVILGGRDGYMADPNLAGLDPIFWLHHCNIDRLWAAWLTRGDKIQENRAAWANGPAPRGFEMPDAAGALVRFNPRETLPGGVLAPEYDDLMIGTGLGAVPAATGGEDEMNATLSADPPPPATLVGTNGERLTVGGARVATTVELDETQADIAAEPVEQHVFLNLENVRGSTPSGVLNVSVSRRATGAMPASAPEALKTIALFGLARASAPDADHAGNGISVAVDVTDLIKRLGHEAGAPLEGLEVHLEQPNAGLDVQSITVERVSLYRQPVE